MLIWHKLLESFWAVFHEHNDHLRNREAVRGSAHHCLQCSNYFSRLTLCSVSDICVLEIHKAHKQSKEGKSFHFRGRLRSKHYSVGIFSLHWGWGKESLLGKSVSWFSSISPVVLCQKRIRVNRLCTPAAFKLCFLLENIDEWLKYVKR